MCWPDADKPMELFHNALAQFKIDLHDILIYSKGINEKYIKVHEDESYKILFIYCQRKTNNILKVVINTDISVEEYQKDPVTIFAEDPSITAQIGQLDSVANMRKYMAEVREIVHADQVMVRLTYGDLSGGNSSQ